MQQSRASRPLIGRILAFFILLVAVESNVLAAEIVVNKSVADAGITASDLRAIFTMQQRFWSNRRQIKVFTLADNSPLHKEFVKDNLKMFPHQIRRIWDRMTYSGTGTAPVELESEQEMMEKIASTPDSIGYVKSKPDHVNVLKVHVD